MSPSKNKKGVGRKRKKDMNNEKRKALLGYITSIQERVSVKIVEIVSIILMIALILVLLKYNYGSVVIAVLSCSLLLFSYFISEEKNIYYAYGILLVVSLFLSFILIIIFEKRIPQIDVSSWSNIFSAIGVFGAFWVEARKLTKRLNEKEKDNVECKKKNYEKEKSDYMERYKRKRHKKKK